jgi:hypothetical protein
VTQPPTVDRSSIRVKAFAVIVNAAGTLGHDVVSSTSEISPKGTSYPSRERLPLYPEEVAGLLSELGGGD